MYFGTIHIINNNNNNNRYHYDLRKYSFSTRIVNTWNGLPESVIAAETTNCFKNRIDKFWNNQEMIFDYKAELTGIGNII